MPALGQGSFRVNHAFGERSRSHIGALSACIDTQKEKLQTMKFPSLCILATLDQAVLIRAVMAGGELILPHRAGHACPIRSARSL
jgi:hypothetical protein